MKIGIQGYDRKIPLLSTINQVLVLHLPLLKGDGEDLWILAFAGMVILRNMIKKILGVLNIASGAIILALLVQLWPRLNISGSPVKPGAIIGMALFILIALVSFISGIRVFQGKHWILATINLILAGLTIFVLLLAIAFASFT